jgi:histidinol-phosphate aminotransferase
MSQFWSRVVNDLKPYTPGEQPKLNDIVKLNTNENPYPPSPKVLTALQQAVCSDLRLYPDPNADALKEVIASYYQVTAQQVFVGNSSDEVLAHTFQALLKHDLPILFPDVTYSFYPVYCGLYEIEYQAIALRDDFSLAAQDYQLPNGGIIFPNPNAPTGRFLELSEVEKILQANPQSVVVVDEAYVDFGGVSAIALVPEYPNRLVVQTLSKSRSLAGLRVGFAIGHPELIAGLERVKNSFNSYPLDRLAQAGAIASFGDQAYFDQTRYAVIASREKLVQRLMELRFETISSTANFILTRHPEHDARRIQHYLRDQNIIVRHFSQPRIDQFLRISIGTKEECERLVQALKAFLQQ